MNQSIQNQLFRLRSLAPLPFYIICLVFSQYNPVFFVSGLVMVASGECLRIYSVGYIGKISRVLKRPSGDLLIESGPFRLNRNPIYTGNILIYLGFTVLSNVFFPYFSLMTLTFFAVNYSLIIRIEEAYLAETFGDDYEKYRQNVNRWLPSFRLKGKTSPSFSFSKAVDAEKPTLAVLALTLILLMIRMMAGS